MASLNDKKYYIWQIVECNALPTLILMLRSEDAAIHYEAVRSYYLTFLSWNYINVIFCSCTSYWMLSELVFDDLQVGVIGNLVHSSPNIKKEVLAAGALQPVIGLLRHV